MHFYDLYAPDGSAKMQAKLRACVAQKKSIRHFLRSVLHENGGVRWLSTNATPKLAKNGRLLGYVGLEEDLTESVTAQLKLAESEARLAAILDNTRDLIWSVDARTFCLLFWNSAFTEFVRIEYGNVLYQGMFSKEVLPPPLVKRWDALFERALREGQFEITYVMNSGKRVFHLAFNLVKNQGTVTAISVFARDITIERKAQRELEQQRQEIARIQRVSTIGQLAASLTHQLGQPLTAILANARAATRFLSASPPLLHDLHDILEDIVKDNRRAAGVINQLGTLLKMEKSVCIDVQLNDLVAKAGELLHSDVAIRQVNVEQQLAYSLPLVRGDPVQLTQVLLNLILNGLEAMQESSREDKSLRVRTFLADDGSVQVSVTDGGPGLSDDQMRRIFEPFYSTKKNGLGMGLAVSRAIMERYQGRLWAENNPDGGSTFYVSLPALVSSETSQPTCA